MTSVVLNVTAANAMELGDYLTTSAATAINNPGTQVDLTPTPMLDYMGEPVNVIIRIIAEPVPAPTPLDPALYDTATGLPLPPPPAAPEIDPDAHV